LPIHINDTRITLDGHAKLRRILPEVNLISGTDARPVF
jgi:hypothetical protein